MPLTGCQRDFLANRLREERERWQGTLRRMEEQGMGVPQGEAYEELSMYDNHPADAGTETFEREKDFGLQGNAHLFLTKIADAERRMEEGTYGTCGRCGREISLERLLAMPMTDLCLGCKKSEELPERIVRPVEERVVRPSFGGGRGTAYDGEDVWDDLRQYGLAAGPQDEPVEALSREDFYQTERDSGVVQAVEGLVDETGEPLSP